MKALNARSDFDYGAAAFVAEDHGLLDDVFADRAVFPVVDVAAAYARELDLNEDIVRFE